MQTQYVKCFAQNGNKHIPMRIHATDFTYSGNTIKFSFLITNPVANKYVDVNVHAYGGNRLSD